VSPVAQAIAGVCIGLIAGSPAYARCANIAATRNQAYTPYIQLVLDDLKAIDRSKGDAAFNASVNALAEKYTRAGDKGDANAVRRVIGIGLFTAMATNAEPQEATFKLVCQAAKRQLPPRNVVDPLTCAVIAVDGSRLTVAANRQLAKEMLDAAKANLDVDLDKAGAPGVLAALSQQVTGCLAP